jgi:hypothetical protein
MNFFGTAIPLSAIDVETAARTMGVETAAVWAVTDVESAGSGFLADKRSKILFEAQVFGRLSGHRWDMSHPNVSSRIWDRSLYGAGGAHQYDRLAEAIVLDETMALESASWGMFQILGLNYLRCGYQTVQAYVNDNAASEGAQLAAFVKFCQAGGIDRWLRNHDWVHFAVAYNGPGERANGYDTKLAAAYGRRVRKLPRLVALHGHTELPETIGLPLGAEAT